MEIFVKRILPCIKIFYLIFFNCSTRLFRTCHHLSPLVRFLICPYSYVYVLVWWNWICCVLIGPFFGRIPSFPAPPTLTVLNSYLNWSSINKTQEMYLQAVHEAEPDLVLPDLVVCDLVVLQQNVKCDPRNWKISIQDKHRHLMSWGEGGGIGKYSIIISCAHRGSPHSYSLCYFMDNRT